MEGFPLLVRDAFDEQPLALADAVLLASHLDDRVAGHSAKGAGSWPASGADSTVFFFLPRPPREPRRVFRFGFSCSSAAGSSAGSSSGASALTVASVVVVAVFFLRPRPPREPRRVRFFGFASVAVSAAAVEDAGASWLGAEPSARTA